MCINDMRMSSSSAELKGLSLSSFPGRHLRLLADDVHHWGLPEPDMSPSMLELSAHGGGCSGSSVGGGDDDAGDAGSGEGSGAGGSFACFLGDACFIEDQVLVTGRPGSWLLAVPECVLWQAR